MAKPSESRLTLRVPAYPSAQPLAAVHFTLDQELKISGNVVAGMYTVSAVDRSHAGMVELTLVPQIAKDR